MNRERPHRLFLSLGAAGICLLVALSTAHGAGEAPPPASGQPAATDESVA